MHEKNIKFIENHIKYKSNVVENNKWLKSERHPKQWLPKMNVITYMLPIVFVCLPIEPLMRPQGISIITIQISLSACKSS